MKELLDKISSYNIFNYIFPGIVFSVFLEKLFGYSIVPSDIIIGFFVYYFVGLTISRIGSLIIEPILKKIKYIKFISYENFVNAEKIDDKLEVLSEVNNTYRTICSMIFLLIVFYAIGYFLNDFLFLKGYELISLLIFLFIIFIYSYRKQTNYIVNRVQAILNKKQGGKDG